MFDFISMNEEGNSQKACNDFVILKKNQRGKIYAKNWFWMIQDKVLHSLRDYYSTMYQADKWDKVEEIVQLTFSTECNERFHCANDVTRK